MLSAQASVYIVHLKRAEHARLQRILLKTSCRKVSRGPAANFSPNFFLKKCFEIINWSKCFVMFAMFAWMWAKHLDRRTIHFFVSLGSARGEDTAQDLRGNKESVNGNPNPELRIKTRVWHRRTRQHASPKDARIMWKENWCQKMLPKIAGTIPAKFAANLCGQNCCQNCCQNLLPTI